jgi:hypothetical protein
VCYSEYPVLLGFSVPVWKQAECGVDELMKNRFLTVFRAATVGEWTIPTNNLASSRPRPTWRRWTFSTKAEAVSDPGRAEEA